MDYTGIAEDCRLLALLHDRELEADVLEALRGLGMATILELSLETAAGRAAVAAIEHSLRDPGDLDALAAEYAAIYLTYAHRIAPCESVWFDDEGLERQAATFQVRDWYRRHGHRVAWANGRPEDHITYQLVFLAHLLDDGADAERMRGAARFLDEHLLLWVPLFAERVALRSPSPFYRALAMLTWTYLDALRDDLAAVTGVDAPTAEGIAALIRGKRAIDCAKASQTMD